MEAGRAWFYRNLQERHRCPWLQRYYPSRPRLWSQLCSLPCQLSCGSLEIVEGLNSPSSCSSPRSYANGVPLLGCSPDWAWFSIDWECCRRRGCLESRWYRGAWRFQATRHALFHRVMRTWRGAGSSSSCPSEWCSCYDHCTCGSTAFTAQLFQFVHICKHRCCPHQLKSRSNDNRWILGHPIFALQSPWCLWTRQLSRPSCSAATLSAAWWSSSRCWSCQTPLRSPSVQTENTAGSWPVFSTYHTCNGPTRRLNRL